MTFTTAYIGIGSNLGDRKKTIEAAFNKLSSSPQIRFLRAAPIYETEPVGGPAQGPYLNTVWEVETNLEACELIQLLLKIESECGRVRKERNEPRTVDLDLLFFGDQVICEPDLVVPHPRLQERWFVLKPMWDLRSDLVHPVLKLSICELLDRLHEGHQNPNRA